MNRRHLLQTTLFAAIAATVAAAEKRAPRILLRSSWQTENIGDSAHTPGVLVLLEKHLPEVGCGCGIPAQVPGQPHSNMQFLQRSDLPSWEPSAWHKSGKSSR